MLKIVGLIVLMVAAGALVMLVIAGILVYRVELKGKDGL